MLEKIKGQIAKIKESIAENDYGSAHAREDALYVNFIRYIAKNANDELAQLAEKVLEADELDFPRWGY